MKTINFYFELLKDFQRYEYRIAVEGDAEAIHAFEQWAGLQLTGSDVLELQLALNRLVLLEGDNATSYQHALKRLVKKWTSPPSEPNPPSPTATPPEPSSKSPTPEASTSSMRPEATSSVVRQILNLSELSFDTRLRMASVLLRCYCQENPPPKPTPIMGTEVEHHEDPRHRR